MNRFPAGSRPISRFRLPDGLLLPVELDSPIPQPQPETEDFLHNAAISTLLPRRAQPLTALALRAQSEEIRAAVLMKQYRRLQSKRRNADAPDLSVPYALSRKLSP